MKHTNTVFKTQTVTYKTNFIVETITVLVVVALFVFSYPKTLHAHYKLYHDNVHILDTKDNKETILWQRKTQIDTEVTMARCIYNDCSRNFTHT